MKLCKLYVMVGLMLVSSPAFAFDQSIPGLSAIESLQNQASPDSNSFGAGLGFGAIGEDYFLKLQLRLDLNLGPVGLGIMAPINMRVWDKGEENNDDYGPLNIRYEDWDEWTEFVKIIRYVRLGHKGDQFYVRVGELTGDIGHGTIVGRYHNNLDLDTFHVGLAFDVNTNYGGIETMFNDIPNLGADMADTRLVASRIYFKPWSLINPESILNRLAIGFSVATDINAPNEIATDTTDPSIVLLDEDGNPQTLSTEKTVVMGFDTEFNVLNIPILSLTPYIDFNTIFDAGWGLHMGIKAVAKLPIGLDLQLPVRLEYRRFKNNYLPSYFNTYYDVERFQFGLTPGLSKRGYLELQDGNEGINGFYGDAAFDFVGIAQIGAIYEDYEGGSPSLAAYLNVPALETLQFTAYYTRNNIEGWDDIFALDDRSLLVAQFRYQIITYVYLVAQWSRTWQMDPQDGAFKASNDFNFGIQTNFTF